MNYATEELRAAVIIARAAVLSARTAGMIAENTLRELRGEHPQYDLSDFEREIASSGLTPNDIVQTAHRGLA